VTKPPSRRAPTQLELPFTVPVAKVTSVEPPKAAAPKPEAPPRPGLRVISGGGQRVHEPLKSRDAVVRVLVEAGADMLLRRISVERGEEIQENVDEILELFDRVDRQPQLMAELRRRLDELEALMSETRELRTARKR
jgi:hypothetical protein